MLVRKIYNKNFFFSLVLALVGNKDDMYQFEEVSNDEGIAFAKELKAIYKRTSAKVASGGGIDDLFKDIGKQFLHPAIAPSIPTTASTSWVPLSTRTHSSRSARARLPAHLSRPSPPAHRP